MTLLKTTCTRLIAGWGFPDEETLLAALQENNSEASQYVLAGVAFTNMPSNGDLPPSRLSYKLRFASEFRQAVTTFSNWFTNMDYPEEQVIGPRDEIFATGGEPCEFLHNPQQFLSNVFLWFCTKSNLTFRNVTHKNVIKDN